MVRAEFEKYVSLWVGQAASENSLRAYVIESGPDDAAIPAFQRAINGDDYDPEFVEIIWVERFTEQPVKLLAGCSYEELLIPAVRRRLGDRLPQVCNAAILLGKYKYEGDSRDVVFADGNMRFVLTEQVIWEPGERGR
jgi:hypothetical protein